MGVSSGRTYCFTSSRGMYFPGFADADETGKYTYYNVPAGDYKIAVNYPDYPNETGWSAQFTPQRQ